MSSQGVQLFSAEKPYESIATFTNRHKILLGEQKKAFIEFLEEFFTERAYLDKSHPMPKGFRERFTEYDVQTFHDVAQELGADKWESRIDRLLAIIAKVAGITLTRLKVPHSVYQIGIFSEASDEKPTYWGWIPGRYVESSKKLTKCVENRQVIIKSEDLDLSILFALSRLATIKSDETTETVVGNLSYEAICNLIIFADEWGVKPLFEELEASSENALPVVEDSEKELILKRVGEHRVNKTIKAFERARKEARPSVSTEKPPNTVFPQYIGGQGDSRWFKKEDPYGSIIHFVKRGCALSGNERLQFFTGVRRFFTIAYNNIPHEIPKKLEKEFARVALPFLLKTMHHNEPERERLLASIQLVANRTFPQVLQSERLRIKLTSYGSPSTPQRYRLEWEMQPYEKLLEGNDPYITPLKVLNLGAEEMLKFSKDSTPEDCVGALLMAFEHSLPSLEQKAYEQLEEKFSNDSMRRELATQFAKHLSRSDVQQAIFRLWEHETFEPDVKVLSKDELYHLLLFRAQNAERWKASLSEIISQCLEPTDHLDSVLERFEETASEEEKEGITNYFCTHAVAIISEAWWCDSRDAVAYLLSDCLDPHYRACFSCSIPEEPGEAEKQKLYTVFKKEEIIRLFQRVSPEKVLEELSALLLEANSNLIKHKVMKRLAEEFFPDVADQVNISIAHKAFLSALFQGDKIKYESYKRVDFCYFVEKVLIKLKINSKELEQLAAFMKKDDTCKQKFENKNISQAFPWLIQQLERTPQAHDLAEAFFNECVVPRFGENENLGLLAKEIFVMVYRIEKSLDYDLMYELRKKIKFYSDRNYVQLALLFQESKVEAWFNEKASDFKSKFYQSLEAGAYNLPVLLEVHAFMEAVKAQELLAKGSSDYQFLERALKDVGRMDLEKFDKPEEVEKLKQELYDTAKSDYWMLKDAETIQQILKNPALTSKLSCGGFSKGLPFLQDSLGQLCKESKKEEEDEKKGECIIA